MPRCVYPENVSGSLIQGNCGATQYFSENSRETCRAGRDGDSCRTGQTIQGGNATMSNIHRLPDVTGVEREAGAWIARLHADDVTSEDLARFEAWRAAHPRHARVFEEISGTIDEV